MRRMHRAGSAVLLSLAMTAILVPSADAPLVDARRIDTRPVAVDARVPEARPVESARTGVPPVDMLSAGALTSDARHAGGAMAVEAAPTRSILHVVDGAAFDTCEAPEVETMRAWRASPYQALGIYVGGSNRGCTNKGLTGDWVRQVHAQGWEFMPIYVGAQASCTVATMSQRIDPARVEEMALAEADDAVARAAGLGFRRGSAIYFDMEEYDNTNLDCRRDVLDFVSAWSERVRHHGFTPGYYSSLSSGIADLVDVAGTRPLPDAIWYARWDDLAVTQGDGALPDHLWPNRRIKQHAGNVSETHGGESIKIDRNAMTAPVGVL